MEESKDGSKEVTEQTGGEEEGQLLEAHFPLNPVNIFLRQNKGDKEVFTN